MDYRQYGTLLHENKITLDYIGIKKTIVINLKALKLRQILWVPNDFRQRTKLVPRLYGRCSPYNVLTKPLSLPEV